jgi:hypothetical protein
MSYMILYICTLNNVLGLVFKKHAPILLKNFVPQL